MKKSLSPFHSSMQRKPQEARTLEGIAINQRRLMYDLNAIGRIS